MSDVLFTGQFELGNALASFQKFANSIRTELGNISKGVSGSNSSATQNRVETLLGINENQFAQVQGKFQKFRDQINNLVNKGAVDPQKAESVLQSLENKVQTYANKLERLNIKREEGINFTKGEVVSMRLLGDEFDRFDDKLENARKTIELSHAGFQKLFVGLTIGGFALQRFGGFLDQTVSEPLKRALHSILAVTLSVNDFEETLRVRGGKSKDQIEEIYKVVKRVSDLPNLERPDVLTIFTRLTEITKGGLTANELEKIGNGLSKITTSLEAGEKRAFYGQLQDILGGGNVANIEKTLSLVPLLKSKYDELKASGTIDPKNQKLLVTAALQQLGDLPNVDNIATSIKRINNEVFEFQRRLGNLYKNDLKILIDFVITKVVPILDSLVTKLEHAPGFINDLILGIVGLGVVLPPLISGIGAFAIAIGGVGFAMAELGITMAGVSTFITATLIPFALNPVTIAIVALIGLIAYLTATNLGGFRDSLSETLDSVVNLTKGFVKLGTSIIDVIDGVNDPRGQTPAQKIGIIKVSLIALGYILDYILLSFADVLTKIVQGLQVIIDAFTDVFSKIGIGFKGLVISVKVALGLISLDEGRKEAEELQESVTAVGVALKNTSDIDKTAGEEALERHKHYNESLTDSIKLVNQLAEVIKKQREAAVQASRDADKSIADYKSEKRITGLTDEVKRIRDEAFKIDVTGEDTTGYDQALAKLKTAGELNLKAARLGQVQTLLDNLHTAFDANAEALTEFVKDQSDTVKDAAVTILGEYAKLPDKLSGKRIADLLDKALLSLVGQVDDKTYRKIQDQFGIQKTRIGTAIKLSRNIQKDIDNAQKDNDDQITELNEKRVEAQKRRALFAEQTQLAENLTGAEFTLSNDEEARKNLTKNKDSIENIIKLRKDIDDAVIESQKAEGLRLDAEKALLEASGKQRIEIDEDIKKATIKSNAELIKIGQDGDKQFNDVIQSIINDKTENSKRLRNLITQFGDELKGNIDLLIRLSSKGIQPDLEKLNQATQAFNKLVSESAKFLQDRATKTLENNLGELARLGDSLEKNAPKNIADTFGKFLTDVRTLGNHPLNQGELDKFIAESEGILNALQNYLLIADALKPTDKAQLLIDIKTITKVIEDLRASRKTLVDLRDITTQTKEIEVGILEHKKSVNDTLKDQLDLEEQILEIRKERNTDSDAPTLSKIFAIISGAERKINEAKAKILEAEIGSAQLQLDIDLKRLEIAERKAEVEINASNLSIEEKASLIKQERDLLKEEEIQVKRKGDLQTQVLNEQLKSLKATISGNSGILGGILDLFKKKKTTKTGAVNADGTVQVNGNDPINPDAINAGQLPPLISDKTAAITDKNAKKSTKSLQEMLASLGKVGKAISAVGSIIELIAQNGLKATLQAIAGELKALSIKYAIKALEFAALAVSYYATGQPVAAAKAAKAAALWGVAAVAAGAGAAFLGHVAGTSAANSESSASSAAGVSSGTYNPNTDPTVLKQKALSVFINLDIRTDDGIIIKKNIKALNENTELTNLVLNSSDGWAFAPAP